MTDQLGRFEMSQVFSQQTLKGISYLECVHRPPPGIIAAIPIECHSDGLPCFLTIGQEYVL
jgi:hypothetical protein